MKGNLTTRNTSFTSGHSAFSVTGVFDLTQGGQPRQQKCANSKKFLRSKSYDEIKRNLLASFDEHSEEPIAMKITGEGELNQSEVPLHQVEEFVQKFNKAKYVLGNVCEETAVYVDVSIGFMA